MSYVKNAMARSRASYNHAHTKTSLASQKASGMVSLTPSGGAAQFSGLREQAQNREKYSLFRGWVYSAVNALAMEAAGQPVHLGTMDTEKDGRKGPSSTKAIDLAKLTASAHSKASKQEMKMILDHPLLNALEEPNPIQHRWQFVYSFVANLNLTGWAFVVGGPVDGGYEFYSLPTTWVKPDHSKGAFAEFRIVNPNDPGAEQSAEPLTRDQVAFACLPNPGDPLSALAPAQAQNNAIKIDEHIQTSQQVFFDNGMFPSVIVTVGKDPHPEVPGGVRPRLTQAQRRQVYGAIRKVSGGIANYGNPAIVDGMIESIERLSATSNEMGWEKSEKAVRTRILSAFSVHPFILGEEGAGSYAQSYNVTDRFCKRVNTYLDMLGTVMTSFARGMDKQEEKAPRPKPKKSKSKLIVSWEPCKPKDAGLDQKLWEGARGRDDISQNEFRAYMNLPPDEDKNEAIINKGSVVAVSGIAEKVKAGSLDPEQAVAILEGMGLPSDKAKDIAGKAPPKPTAAEAALAQSSQAVGQAAEALGAKPKPKPGALPKPGEKPKPAAKPNAKPAADAEDIKKMVKRITAETFFTASTP